MSQPTPTLSSSEIYDLGEVYEEKSAPIGLSLATEYAEPHLIQQVRLGTFADVQAAFHASTNPGAMSVIPRWNALHHAVSQGDLAKAQFLSTNGLDYGSPAQDPMETLTNAPGDHSAMQALVDTFSLY